MIDFAGVRAWLEAAVAVEGVVVYPRGVDGPFEAPAVVLGQPDVSYSVESRVGRTTRVEWPVAVVVRVDPAGPAASQDQLEGLWPVVVDALESALAGDESMGGLIGAAWVVSSVFGDFGVQGQRFPAYSITVEIYE